MIVFEYVNLETVISPSKLDIDRGSFGYWLANKVDLAVLHRSPHCDYMLLLGCYDPLCPVQEYAMIFDSLDCYDPLCPVQEYLMTFSSMDCYDPLCPVQEH